MKKNAYLMLIVAFISYFSVLADQNNETNKSKLEGAGTFTCVASAPPTALVNEAVQFQSFASEGIGGTLVGLDNIVGNMRFVPASDTYIAIGSPATEPGRSLSEEIFYVKFSRNIAVMETEFTRQMWEDLLAQIDPITIGVGPDPSDTNYSNGMQNPVQTINFCQILLIANRLSVLNGFSPCYYINDTQSGVYGAYTGCDSTIVNDIYCDFSASGYRLLTESEWEYCCRAGTTSEFSVYEANYGSNTLYSCTLGVLPALESIAIFCANSSGISGVVGSKGSNSWNLKDMHGNVSEWCWDRFGSHPINSSVVDYTGPTAGFARVVKGGSFLLNPNFCRAASRESIAPTYGRFDLGFRFARTL